MRFKIINVDGKIRSVNFNNEIDFEDWFNRFNSVNKNIQIKRYKDIDDDFEGLDDLMYSFNSSLSARIFVIRKPLSLQEMSNMNQEISLWIKKLREIKDKKD